MEDVQKVLDELKDVRPEKLTGEAKRLFEAIMKIADERDELIKERQADKEKIKNSIPKAKVEEKIEEHKNMIKERPEHKAIIEIHINELQELLKDGGE